MPRTSNVFAFTSNSFSTPVQGEVIDPTDAASTWADIVVGLNSSPVNANYIGKTIQPWVALSCVNGANTDLALPSGTNFYITGPTGIFTISGLAASGGNEDGRLMFVDFFGVCMDQIYNHLAKNTYMSGGALRLPVVLTTAFGGGYNDAAQHSQSLYGLFAHVPGLKVVVPSNAYDAKGLMVQAIRDDNPVMYFFHKGLMGLGWMSSTATAATPVPEEPYTVSFGKADVKREGKDVTIVTLGLMVHRFLEAAAELAKKGVSAEVIDLRTLVPLDRAAVLASVRKTGRLLVVDEDYRSFGLSGEIAATVAEADPRLLRVPFRRPAVPDVPIPYSRPLEGFVFPNAQKIAEAVGAMMA